MNGRACEWLRHSIGRRVVAASVLVGNFGPGPRAPFGPGPCFLWPLFPHALSAIDVVMRSDIQQHDLGSREAENQDDAVGIGQADRMFVGVSSLEPVQSQTGRLRISLQLLEDVLEQTDS